MFCTRAALASSGVENTMYACAVALEVSTLPVSTAARRGMATSSLTGMDRSRTESTFPYLQYNDSATVFAMNESDACPLTHQQQCISFIKHESRTVALTE